MKTAERNLLVGLSRASGGAVLFALPLLMTMEMWWLGFYMERSHLAVLMVAMIPLLIALDHYSGFQETHGWREDVLDGLIAYGVGIVASAAILLLFNVIDLTQPLREIVGKVAIQSVPASFGAVLANSQLGGAAEGEKPSRGDAPGYAGEVFFMAAGALFLAFNVAPTEEMILIAFMMTPWHALMLIVASLAVMHGFVFTLEFRGSHPRPRDVAPWSVFLRFTVVGYAVALLVSAFVLWTFGRFSEGALASDVMNTLVLAFPASLGAAAARLVL
jgi:putative integral membrane protein (TIGR02587 family)